MYGGMTKGWRALVIGACCMAALGSSEAQDVDASVIGVLYGSAMRNETPLPAAQVEVFLFMARPCGTTAIADHRYATTTHDEGGFRVGVEQFGGGPPRPAP